MSMNQWSKHKLLKINNLESIYLLKSALSSVHKIAFLKSNRAVSTRFKPSIAANGGMAAHRRV
jgi:hypothetical protein